MAADKKIVQYGQVERVYIDRDRSGSIPVFVKFTSHLSALRVSRPTIMFKETKLRFSRL